MDKNPLIVILGPTATGKTKLATKLANEVNGEIISADSRQVYKGMDIGTGKDYEDYTIDNTTIPYHLIDIVEPGYEYNVYEFQEDFLKAYNGIISRSKTPMLCGGTGMYIEAVLKGYKLVHVPKNPVLRKHLGNKNKEELTQILSTTRELHNTTDTENIQRLIRAIEIDEYYKENPSIDKEFPNFSTLIFGVYYDRQIIRERITQRLEERLKEGMIEEAEALLDKGLKPGQLKFYGLEYKFLTLYIEGKLTYDEMFTQLNTAIHQFAKRQMTWFRRMERKGIEIVWLEEDNKLKQLLRTLKKVSENTNNHLPSVI